MPLKLVIGPANAAKAGEVLGGYEDAARREALLVVPTALDAQHYGRELASRGTVLGAVHTFKGLAEEIAARAGYSAPRLSKLQRERVLRRAIGGLTLDVLSESAAARGFPEAAGRLIAELERALISPQRFAHAMRAWGDADQRRGSYAHEVASLYLAYAHELDRIGRVDGELYAWRALDALRAKPGAWGSTPVFFYGFDDFSPLELDAIETLCRVVSAQVTVSLTYESGRVAFSSGAEVAESLRALADQVVELPALDEHYASRSRAALHHLERSLFEPSSQRADPGEGVRLLEAGGERAEAELIADEVLALLRAGVPASEIVIVCRSPERAAPAIENVFDRYGIPLTSDRRLRLIDTAIGRASVALLRCAVQGESASAADMLAYLRAPGLLERPELADRLEARALREGMTSAGELRAQLGWELGELDSIRQSDNLLDELARQARRMFAAPRRGSGMTLPAREEREARALAALLRALEELGDLGERPSGTELIELLEALELDSPERERPEAVLIADPLGIRARRFRAVFVCGLCEGEFPRIGSSEPFLSDERRWELGSSTGVRLPPVEDGLARERHLFYACVSRATEQLVLSYRSSDEEGSLSLPSPFIADVADTLSEEWQERRRRRLLADVVWSADAAPTERERARAEAAQSAGAFAPSAPPALTERALAHVRHRELASAGALEAYADCPMKWLIERELEPLALEPEPDPLARGRYMHEVLEQLLLRLGGPVTPESLPDAKRLLGQLPEELPPTIAAGRAETVRAAIELGVQADLERYLAFEAQNGCAWRPESLELKFGFEGEEEGSLPALALGEGESRVLLRGVIDRVDVDPASTRKAIVRDYKSGSARPEHPGARWSSDRQLQVALYMLAVRELLRLEPVAGVYQPLGGDDLRPRGLFERDSDVGASVVAKDARSPEELQEALRDAEQRAVAIAARLRAGELAPCPHTCSRDGCRYPGICRSS